MASHGIPRTAARQQRSAEDRQKELQAIEEYRTLINSVHEKIENRDFSPEALEKTGALLQRNPEYYTIWNIRRRIYSNEFGNIRKSVEAGAIVPENGISQYLDIIQLDLQFLIPLLMKYPKCYWIWNHRVWLLQQSSNLLPTTHARKIWEAELGLVSKMLTRDSRNYHGWGYRRFVVENLEDPGLGGHSMAKDEYDHTTKMIGSNLSNFSAWHNRTRLIQRMLDERNANAEDRRSMLDEELALIHNALFDPYDQSLWFYHQTLMNAFDPERCEKTMAPNLALQEKLTYIEKEKCFIEEVLEDASDCKWVYQALIDCATIEAKLKNEHTEESRADIRRWLAKLKDLDPLRAGRWSDMEANLI